MKRRYVRCLCIMYHVQVEYVHDQHASRQHGLQRVHVGLTTLPLRGFVRQHLAGKNFSDFYISFGACGIIIISNFQKYLGTEI